MVLFNSRISIWFFKNFCLLKFLQTFHHPSLQFLTMASPQIARMVIVTPTPLLDCTRQKQSTSLLHTHTSDWTWWQGRDVWADDCTRCEHFLELRRLPPTGSRLAPWLTVCVLEPHLQCSKPSSTICQPVTLDTQWIPASCYARQRQYYLSRRFSRGSSGLWLVWNLDHVCTCKAPLARS